MKNLIGKIAIITNKDHYEYENWGVIKHYDGDYYYIAMNEGQDIMPVFDRDEFRIPKNQEYYKNKIAGN